MLTKFLYILILLFIVSCDMQGGSLNRNVVSADDNSPMLAKIGSNSVSQQALDLELTALPGGKSRASRPGGHRAELEKLIDLIAAEKEGESRKINENPRYQQKLALLKTKARRAERDLMYEMLYTELNKSGVVTDQQLSVYYEKHKNRFLTSNIHLRRIATKTKGEMEAAQKRLKNGETFEEVAAIFNTDENLRATSGDMGPVLRNELPVGLRVAAFGLQKANDVSLPFEAEQTWNILKLVKKENGVVRPLKDVKGQLLREIKRSQAQQALVQAIKSRREKMGVTIYEDQVAKLGPALIPANARPHVSAGQLKVPQNTTAMPLKQKQVKSGLQQGAGGH